MAADLLQVLSNASKGLQSAHGQLERFQKEAFSEYLLSLCQILTSKNNNNISNDIRQMAGIALKNSIGGGRSEDYINTLRKRWTQTKPEVRAKVKEGAFQVLGSGIKQARVTGAMLISRIAAIETIGNWKDLLPKLLTQLSTTGDDGLVEAIFICIGYICEECSIENLKPFSSKILDAVAKGMNKNILDVSIAAIKCLTAILELVNYNMQQESEQRIIMQIICASCTHKDPQLRLNGYMALVKTAGLYYHHFNTYIRFIFDMTGKTIAKAVESKEDEEIGKQAIEFWTTIAEVECDIIEQNNDSKLKTKKPVFGFVGNAQKQLIPLYLKALEESSDDLDDDAWTLRKASAVSLESFALVKGNETVELVIKFVQQNISNSNWKLREAAVCAFGHILEGPAKAPLQQLVGQVCPFLFKLMQDNEKMVKKSAAWAFGRVCQIVPDGLRGSNFMPPLKSVIDDCNEISHYGSWALASLADYYEQQQVQDAPLRQPQAIFNVINSLLQRAQRQDSNPHLITSCFEAINQIVCCAPKQTQAIDQMIRGLVPELTKRLKQVCTSNDVTGDKVQQMMQSLLTSIYVCVGVLEGGLDESLCNQIMTCCMEVLKTNSALIVEEVLSCIGTIASTLDDKFFKYIQNPHLQDLILSAVGFKHNNSHLCMIGVGVAGDVIVACTTHIQGNGSKIQNFADKLVQHLLTLLVSDDLDLDVKPHILAAFSDIGIAFGKHWERYTKPVIENTMKLALTELPSGVDEVTHEDMAAVRGSAIEVIRATVFSYLEKNQYNELQMMTSAFLQLIDVIAESDFTDEATVGEVLEFLIEIGEDLKGNPQSAQLRERFRHQSVQKFITKASGIDGKKEKSADAFRALS